jgi:alkylation response protein AidB-like acyl-CoA dehydrogenase
MKFRTIQVVNGQKIWIGRAEHSDYMVLLARTTPKDRGRFWLRELASCGAGALLRRQDAYTT